MKQGATDIVLVVDRSGSMHSIRDDAQGGINALVADQAAQPGEARLTLVQFDTEYEFVHQGVPAGEVPTYELFPRGSTALLDAVGRAIAETAERRQKQDEAERAALVLFVVMTDGKENSSREYTLSQVRELIEKHQQEGWHFTFLGADPAAFAEAGGMGIGAAGAAQYSRGKVEDAFRGTSAKLARMRGQLRRGEQVSNEYTQAERSAMLDDDDDSGT